MVRNLGTPDLVSLTQDCQCITGFVFCSNLLPALFDRRLYSSNHEVFETVSGKPTAIDSAFRKQRSNRARHICIEGSYGCSSAFTCPGKHECWLASGFRRPMIAA